MSAFQGEDTSQLTIAILERLIERGESLAHADFLDLAEIYFTRRSNPARALSGHLAVMGQDLITALHRVTTGSRTRYKISQAGLNYLATVKAKRKAVKC
jgi:hypothetical protein